MDVSEIRDKDTLEAWLESRPRQNSILIAERAASRVFPLWGREMGRDWARERHLTALPVCRRFVILRVARKYPTRKVQDATGRSLAAVHAATLAAANTSLATATATLAVDAASMRATAARSYAAAAARAANTARAAAAAATVSRVSASAAANLVWTLIKSDCAMLVAGMDPTTTPLWPDGPPDWFTEADQETRAIWAQEPEHWEFWTRWWDSVIKGEPLPDQLLHDIALIPDTIWKQGPGPVAEEIRKLEEREALRAEVATLKEQLQSARAMAVATPDHRGHNNPPELLDAPAEVNEAVTIIWQELEKAEEELAKPSQSGTALEAIGTAIFHATKVVLRYCGGKLDTAITGAVEEAGKAVGKAVLPVIVAGALGMNIERLAAFGQWLIDFATKWP